jgi:hypothetical protein
MAQPGEVAADLVAESAGYAHTEVEELAGGLAFQDFGFVGPALVQGNLEALFGGTAGKDGPHRLSPGAIGTKTAFNGKGIRFGRAGKRRLGGEARQKGLGDGIRKKAVFFEEAPLSLLLFQALQRRLGPGKEDQAPGSVVKPVEEAPLPLQAAPGGQDPGIALSAPAEQGNSAPERGGVHQRGLIDHQEVFGLRRYPGLFGHRLSLVRERPRSVSMPVSSL